MDFVRVHPSACCPSAGHQVWRPSAGTPAFARVRSKCFSAVPSTRRSILGFDIFVGEGRAEGGVHVLSIVKTCRACMRHWQSCRTATDGLGIRILFAPPSPRRIYPGTTSRLPASPRKSTPSNGSPSTSAWTVTRGCMQRTKLRRHNRENAGVGDWWGC